MHRQVVALYVQWVVPCVCALVWTLGACAPDADDPLEDASLANDGVSGDEELEREDVPSDEPFPDDLTGDPGDSEVDFDGGDPGDSEADLDAAVSDTAPPDADVPDDADTEPPYRGLIFDAEASELTVALSRQVECVQYAYLGGPRFDGSGDCHTQGIVPTMDGLITSCQDRDEDIGFLQRYRGALEDYGRESITSPQWAPLHAGVYSHAVVGQGFPGTNLVVVVSSAAMDTAARVEVRDGDERLCGFDHAPTAQSTDLHLGAASLAVQDGQVLLVACSWNCDHVFVYGIDPDVADCAPELRSESATERTPSLRSDAGAGDANWGEYNALSVFQDTGGATYLLASHTEWLDTWRLVGFGEPAVRFEKIAKRRWGQNPAGHGDRGLFYEGMAVQELDARTMRIWAAPHDYGPEDCGAERVCVRAVYACDVVLR